MALTLRSNGVGGGLISASWFNDFYNLFTGVMTDQAVTFGNNLTVNGSNGIICNGKIGKSAAGDIIDASGTNTYLKANTGTIYFQDPSGTNQYGFNAAGTGIQVNFSLGFRTFGGTKLAEMKNNGNFTIGGTQYQTTAGSISTVTGQSFDTFDVGEVFQCDKEYPNGTVVCPSESEEGKLTLCTHDNCYAALLVSYNPGLGLGENKHAEGVHYIALAGRVNALTAASLVARTLVVSDGRGGVRAVRPGEPSFTLGFTLNATSVIEGHPVVGLFIRPMFVVLKGH